MSIFSSTAAGVQEGSRTMKDQYFGDINDYRKYGLLRAITASSGLRLLVVWMLTPDEGSTPPPRTVSLTAVFDPSVAQPADAFLGCGIAQYNQRHHGALRPASDSADGGPDPA